VPLSSTGACATALQVIGLSAEAAWNVPRVQGVQAFGEDDADPLFPDDDTDADEPMDLQSLADAATAEQAAACETALQVIGFSAEATRHVTRVQGVQDLGSLSILTDKEISIMCRNIPVTDGNPSDVCRHILHVTSGHFTTAPLHCLNPAVHLSALSPPLLKPPSGVEVSLIVETNLKLLVYYLRRCPPKALDIATLTLDKIWSLVYYDRYLQRMSDHHLTMGNLAVPEIQEQDWPHILTMMMEYSYYCHGSPLLPLKYVAPGPSFVHKLAVPATTSVNEQPNNSLWQGIIAKTHNTRSWPLVQPYEKARDAYKASWALTNHHQRPGLLKATRAQRKSMKCSLLSTAWRAELKHQRLTNKDTYKAMKKRQASCRVQLKRLQVAINGIKTAYQLSRA
jgi:hypothetical protein